MATDDPVTVSPSHPDSGPPSSASPASGTPPSAFCITCDYPLAAPSGATAGICPECGRAFDLSIPSTITAKPGRIRRKRLIRRIVAVAAMIALAAALMPRGYVVCTLTLSAATGLKRTITRTQLVPPTWLNIPYPGWTSDADTSTSAAAAQTPSVLMFSFSAQKRWFDWRGGSKSGGAMSASGGSTSQVRTGLNGLEVTQESAANVTAAIAKQMASTQSIGIRVGRTDRYPSGATDLAPEDRMRN